MNVAEAIYIFSLMAESEKCQQNFVKRFVLQPENCQVYSKLTWNILKFFKSGSFLRKKSHFNLQKCVHVFVNINIMNSLLYGIQC